MPVTAAPNRQNFWLQYLSLFSSLGTLLCCALPSLLVLFGLGRHCGLAANGGTLAGQPFASQELGVYGCRCTDWR